MSKPARDKGRGESPRLVIVSNRLPFTVAMEEGAPAFRESTGGLVTGLRSFLERVGTPSSPFSRYLWVGWPGGTPTDEARAEVRGRAAREFHSHPVFLTESEMESFYHGFCNKTVWPLFHYFPSFTVYNEGAWGQYRLVNEIFCDALSPVLEPGDVVWIHDYHLMLLPRMVRARHPDQPVGFFLHIPFPSFELFRQMPEEWRCDILEGILGADLVGFHTFEYTQHFLQSVLRILGYEHTTGRIFLPTRVVQAEAFPMGIDFDAFSRASDIPAVAEARRELRNSLPAAKTVLSIDRLDYSKGILNRLEGFEELLEGRPELRGSVVLVAVVVPSRVAVDQYEAMKRQIEEMVGKINGKFGTIGWTPVIYQFRQIPFASLAALYMESDVALVTPLRDGMNLIAKEYLAARSDERGVLVLSEMAGAAQELREAVIINPNSRRAIADAVLEALGLSDEEQRRRNRLMRKRLQRYDVLRWANDFAAHLQASREFQTRFTAKVMKKADRNRLLQSYLAAPCRAIFLDYDGTLAPFTRRPEQAAPGADVIALLRALANDPKNTLVIVSGRERLSLEGWFGTLPIGLVAEHGAWRRPRDGVWQALRSMGAGWKTALFPILELYADRLPGAFVEEKDFSLAWHYRSADPERGSTLSRELADQLSSYTANIDVQVLQGSKVLEVRCMGINKGEAAAAWLRDEPQFVLAIGDDWTDEDLFRALPPDAHTIRVGLTGTIARHNLSSFTDVLALLRSLADDSAAVAAGLPAVPSPSSTS